MSQNEVDWTTHYTVYYVGYHKYDFEKKPAFWRELLLNKMVQEKKNV